MPADFSSEARKATRFENLDHAHRHADVEQRRAGRHDNQIRVTCSGKSIARARRHIDEQHVDPALFCQRDCLADLLGTTSMDPDCFAFAQAPPFIAGPLRIGIDDSDAISRTQSQCSKIGRAC
jgi:hypothetical protein